MNCLRYWKMKVFCVKAVLNQEASTKRKEGLKRYRGTLAGTQSTERVEGAKREAGEARQGARILREKKERDRAVVLLRGNIK